MIELRHITSSYGDKNCNKKILNDITVNFPKGKLTIILGPNGSGKTTLIKIALGLIEKDSGEIIIDKKNIASMKLKEIAKKVSYLPQSRNIPTITAEKMVLHGRFPYLEWPRHYSQKDKDIVIESMKKTNCEYLKNRLMTDLSGGERQKVYLAMALAQNTPAIFMDEPTTYLDPEHQLSVMKKAKELCDDGKTVIMVLHDLSLALENGDNIIVINHGSLIKTGSCDEIYKSGILEKVFHVKIARTETKNGFHYWAQME